MSDVTFHPLAAREYLAARRWYARRSRRAAIRFRLSVDQLVQLIAEFPTMGVPFVERYRWRKVQRYPFLIYYRIFPDAQITILAVAHASRRLGYWMRRTSP